MNHLLSQRCMLFWLQLTNQRKGRSTACYLTNGQFATEGDDADLIGVYTNATTLPQFRGDVMAHVGLAAA